MTTDRGTCWSVTINNPTKSDDEGIALARQKSGWKVYGQREKGENGTEHYQLMVTTPQTRFSALKRIFPRAHIELARDRTALSKYVQKEDTRVGSLTSDQELYTSMQKLWDMFANYLADSPKGRKGAYEFWGPEELLSQFDKFIWEKIEQGYIVETMAVNPQIRSSVKQYGKNIINRSLRRQTDRQTDENNIEVSNITTNASQEFEAEEQEICPYEEIQVPEDCSRESVSISDETI